MSDHYKYHCQSDYHLDHPEFLANINYVLIVGIQRYSDEETHLLTFNYTTIEGRNKARDKLAKDSDVRLLIDVEEE